MAIGRQKLFSIKMTIAFLVLIVASFGALLPRFGILLVQFIIGSCWSFSQSEGSIVFWVRTVGLGNIAAIAIAIFWSAFRNGCITSGLEILFKRRKAKPYALTIKLLKQFSYFGLFLCALFPGLGAAGIVGARSIKLNPQLTFLVATMGSTAKLVYLGPKIIHFAQWLF